MLLAGADYVVLHLGTGRSVRVLTRRQLVVLWTLITLTAVGLVVAVTVWRNGGIALFGIAGWHFSLGSRK